MALAVYFVDAALNFPMERPVMQSFFVLISALALNAWLESRKPGNSTSTGKPILYKIPLIIMFLISIGAAWVGLQVYKSLVLQSFVNNDLTLDKPVGSAEQYNNAFPKLPTLNSQALPIDLLRAKYLMKDKKYAEALAYLTKSKQSNPYLGYDELIRARVYFADNNFDSAYASVKRAFYTKPRSRSTYQLLNWIGGLKKDTIGLQSFFDTVYTYRKDPWTWNEYLRAMGHATYSLPRLNAMMDSAMRLFPEDTLLKRTRTIIPYVPGTTNSSGTANNNTGNQPVTNQTNTQNVATEDALDIFNKGNLAYSKQDYRGAIPHFLKYASLNSSDYLGFEAAGLSYYSLKDYNNAMRYLKEAVKRSGARDGKSEYYIGQSLLALGRNQESCPYFKIADQKKFGDAKLFLCPN
jgi:tetratricopeptide (TPR) repeat protein